MHSKQWIWISFLLLGLAGCEKVVNVPGPTYRRQAVLTGLIQPDSVLRVRLTYNQPASDTTANETIENAQVRFFENDQALGTAEPTGQGYYGLRYYPKPGASYRVVATIPGYGEMQAQDQLPRLPVVSLTAGASNAANSNHNPDFSLRWQAYSDSTVYWLSPIIQASYSQYGPGCPANFTGPLPPGCTIEEKMTTRNGTPISNSQYADRFNASSELEYGYVFAYSIRIDPTQLPTGQILFPFTVFNSVPRLDRRKPGEGLIVDFIAAGSHYDRYLKSLIRALQNRVTDSGSALDNPFVEATPVYSNVTNGLGIFGAANQKRLRY